MILTCLKTGNKKMLAIFKDIFRFKNFKKSKKKTRKTNLVLKSKFYSQVHQMNQTKGAMLRNVFQNILEIYVYMKCFKNM